MMNGKFNFVMWQVIVEPAHFIMERKMLLGIKQRVEAAARLIPVTSDKSH